MSVADSFSIPFVKAYRSPLCLPLDSPVEQDRYRIKAVNAGVDMARHLAVPRGRALLLIERTSFTHGDKQIYYQRRYYRSDRVAYNLEVERRPGEARPTALRDFEPVFT